MALISSRMPGHAFLRTVDGSPEALAEVFDFFLVRIVISRTDRLDVDFKGTSGHDARKVRADGDEAVKRGKLKIDVAQVRWQAGRRSWTGTKSRRIALWRRDSGRRTSRGGSSSLRSEA